MTHITKTASVAVFAFALILMSLAAMGSVAHADVYCPGNDYVTDPYGRTTWSQCNTPTMPSPLPSDGCIEGPRNPTTGLCPGEMGGPYVPPTQYDYPQYTYDAPQFSYLQYPQYQYNAPQIQYQDFYTYYNPQPAYTPPMYDYNTYDWNFGNYPSYDGCNNFYPGGMQTEIACSPVNSWNDWNTWDPPIMTPDTSYYW